MLSHLNAAKPVEDTPSSFDSVLKTTSEDGVEYNVSIFSTHYDAVEDLYNNILTAKESLSPVGKVESKEVFIKRLFSNDTVFFSIKDDAGEVGVAYVTDIIPAYSAEFNFLFWDRRTKGRQRLVLAIMKWLSEEFLIRRFELRYHALAFYALHRIYKLGVFYEGTKRKAWRYEDKIIDLHIFSVLANELTDEALKNNHIDRSAAHRKWYAKLTKGGSNE